mgnify:CR=1 FL=1
MPLTTAPTLLLLLACLAWVPLQAGAQEFGRIERSGAAIASFRRVEPCPVTSHQRGACPGWAIDHVIPLCAGGEDKPANMQWITNEDHRFKTLVDVRECRKLRAMASAPAGMR